MSTAAILVKQQFGSPSGEHYPGDIVPMEQVAAWPEGMLVRRIENGFCTVTSVQTVAAEEKPTRKSKPEEK